MKKLLAILAQNGVDNIWQKKMEHFHISSKQCWNPSLLIIVFSLKIINIPITFFPRLIFLSRVFHTFTAQCYTLSSACHNRAAVFRMVSLKIFDFSFSSSILEKEHLQPSSSKEKGFFFFTYFFHVEWLNFTLHWHIWGDAPWNQSNSGISEEEYFWKLQRYVVTLLPPALDRLLYYVTAVILVACLPGW